MDVPAREEVKVVIGIHPPVANSVLSVQQGHARGACFLHHVSRAAAVVIRVLQQS
jgi:hypothetical protein